MMKSFHFRDRHYCHFRHAPYKGSDRSDNSDGSNKRFEMNYRYRLERYKGTRTRHTCPACGYGREFVRYVDTQAGTHLADHVGRCNREVNCGYHYTPKQYFADNGIATQNKDHRRTLAIKQTERPPKLASFIPFETFRRSQAGYADNAFVRYLHNLFDAHTANELIKRFHLGTSNYWRGATVFWQIDIKGRVRSGKIMLYDSVTGRRVKDIQPDGSKRSRITWAHSILLKQGIVQAFNLRQCLFGAHQLSSLHRTKPIAVVEAEKTAIIATVYLPDFIWLACGSLNNLTAEKCSVIAGREVVLFPDLNCFEKWRGKAKRLQALLDCSITVFDLLERRATKADKEKGFDLADYLISSSLASDVAR